MNTRERFVRTLTGQPVDRVPFLKVFGGTNAIQPAWERDAPGLSGSIDRVLGFEGVYRGWGTTEVNVGFSQVGPAAVVREDEDCVVHRSGDGTVMLHRKRGDYHRQILEWPVKTDADWRRLKARHLQPDDPSRFPRNWPERVAEYRQRDYPLQLTHGGVFGFARNLMGDVALMYALYDAPELVHDIMDRYTDMVLDVWARMVREVEFDLVEFWEDMPPRTGSSCRRRCSGSSCSRTTARSPPSPRSTASRSCWWTATATSTGSFRS